MKHPPHNLNLALAVLCAATLSALGGKVAPEMENSPSRAGDRSEGLSKSRTLFRGSYFKNGEIHVNTYGNPEGKPLTSGHQDFKPSWSKTGDMLVFFRRLKSDPVVTNWVTQITLGDGSTIKVSTDPKADYRYPHCEATPK